MGLGRTQAGKQKLILARTLSPRTVIAIKIEAPTAAVARKVIKTWHGGCGRRSSSDRQIMKLAINFRSKLAQLPGKPQKQSPPLAGAHPRPLIDAHAERR